MDSFSGIGVKRYYYNPMLLEYREKNGLTQVRFAESIPMILSRYQGIETYKKYPDDKEKTLLSDIVDIPEDVLFPEWMKEFYCEKKVRKVYRVHKEQLFYTNRLLMANYDKDIAYSEKKFNSEMEVEKALCTLKPREREVIERRYGFRGIQGATRTMGYDYNGKPIDEYISYSIIGKAMNVSRERVRAIEQKAIRKLRHPSRHKALKGII